MSEILPCQIEGLDGSIVSVDVAVRQKDPKHYFYNSI